MESDALAPACGAAKPVWQKERVEVITLRNPETVEVRIWDKLNRKIENIMLAFGHVMDEPEDFLQMVPGMTSPSLFEELFGDAPRVFADSPETWFDQKTATFDGRDVSKTVKAIAGNSAVGGVGADGGGRTHTLLRVPDFESSASANSATSATVPENTIAAASK